LGNTKLDDAADPDPSLGSTAAEDRFARLSARRSVVVWGCLRPGEEELATATVRSLADGGNAFWVFAPRHATDFDRTAEILNRADLRFVRWSADDDHADERVDVLLLDTLGELRAFYARADVAIGGGTFEEFGGHNLMEPALFGVPVIFGPDTSDWPEDAATLIRTGGGLRVSEGDELREALEQILNDRERRHEMGRRARRAASVGRGASSRVIDALLAFGFFDRVSRDPGPRRS
jgi:3-deoxy-D-manno-octulosonic-acid transferase